MVLCKIFIEPNLDETFTIDTDHSVSDFEWSHFFIALLESPEGLTEHIYGLWEGQSRHISQSFGDFLVDDLDVELVATHGSVSGLEVVSTVNFHQCLLLMLPEVVNFELILGRVEGVCSDE